MRTLTRLPVLLTLLAFALAGCAIEGTPDFERKTFTGGGGGGTEFVPTPPTPMARSFTILHTNDEHSHLLGSGPNSDYTFMPAAVDLGGDTTCIDLTGAGGPADMAACEAPALGGICEWTSAGCAGSGLATISGAYAKLVGGVATTGGMARRDFLLNKLRMEATDPVLTVSAGDNTMGTLFHVAGTLGAPDWLAMNLAGYDYMTLGNHEFDWGPDALGLTIKAGSEIAFGGLPQIIASNIHFEDVDTSVPTSAGNLLLSQYGPGGSGALIQPWDVKLLANGLKVGVLGSVGYEAQLSAGAKSPISFSVPKTGAACVTSATCGATESCTQGFCVDPLDAMGHVGAVAAELQAHVTALRDDMGVDVVVLISHMGTTEDYAIAGLTTGIDVIVGGHSHDYLPAHVIDGTTTIVAQAGRYGGSLGQLTVTVDPDGTVSIDDTRTALHDVDSTLDAQIFEGTNLATQTVSPALQRAVTVTLGVIGPVMHQLNGLFAPSVDQLAPAGTLADLWSATYADGTTPLFNSAHDITGASYGDTAESHLIHLVTDAELAVVAGKSCYADATNPLSDATYMVAIQSAGVPRDNLEFDADGSASFADIYRAMPNYVSPFQPTIPGNPLVAFQFDMPSVVAALDIGFTNGLDSQDFFLSYSGMRASYDTTFPPMNPATFETDLGSGSAQPLSRLQKLEIGSDTKGYTTIFEYDTSDTTTPWVNRWVGGAKAFGTSKVLVVTNFYLAGFMFAFGLEPLAPMDGAAIPGSGIIEVLGQTILCNDNEVPVPNCSAGTPAIKQCIVATEGTIPWDPDEFVEVKEWAALFGYLQQLQATLGGSIPNCVYESSETNAACPAFPERVIDATP